MKKTHIKRPLNLKNRIRESIREIMGEKQMLNEVQCPCFANGNSGVEPLICRNSYNNMVAVVGCCGDSSPGGVDRPLHVTCNEMSCETINWGADECWTGANVEFAPTKDNIGVNKHITTGNPLDPLTKYDLDGTELTTGGPLDPMRTKNMMKEYKIAGVCGCYAQIFDEQGEWQSVRKVCCEGNNQQTGAGGCSSDSDCPAININQSSFKTTGIKPTGNLNPSKDIREADLRKYWCFKCVGGFWKGNCVNNASAMAPWGQRPADCQSYQACKDSCTRGGGISIDPSIDKMINEKEIYGYQCYDCQSNWWGGKCVKGNYRYYTHRPSDCMSLKKCQAGCTKRGMDEVEPSIDNMMHEATAKILKKRKYKN